MERKREGYGRGVRLRSDQCLFISRDISLVRDSKDYIEVKRKEVMCEGSSLNEK